MLDVINVAHGEFFAVGGYLAFVAIVVVGLPAAAGIAASAVGAFALGLLVYPLLLAPLKRRLGRRPQGPLYLVLTLGLSTFMQASLLALAGGDYRQVPPHVRGILDLTVTAVSYQRLLVLAVAAALLGALFAFLRFHRQGLAVRAVAQNPEAAQAMGIALPVIFAVTLALGVALAAAGGALMAPLVNVYPAVGFPLTIKAFAITILGGMGNLAGALLASVVVGVVESLGVMVIPSEWQNLIAFAVMIGVLLVRPHGLLGGRRPDGDAAGRPRRARGRGGAVAAGGAPPVRADDRHPGAGLGAPRGELGPPERLHRQISFGHAGFFALGAYAAAALTKHAGLSPWAGLAAGALLAAAMGLGVGFPALRLRGHYLALVTLGFAEILRLVAQNWLAVTGGPFGIHDYRTFPGLPAEPLAHRLAAYWVVLGVVGGAVLVMWLVCERTPAGKAFRAIREDEVLAATLGINTTAYKLLAFALSAGFAGLAGTLYAYYVLLVSPSVASAATTSLVIGMAVFGGLGTIWGPVLGAVLLYGVNEALRFVGVVYNLIVVGLVIVLFVIFLPSGLAGLGRPGPRRVARRDAALADTEGHT